MCVDIMKMFGSVEDMFMKLTRFVQWVNAHSDVIEVSDVSDVDSSPWSSCLCAGTSIALNLLYCVVFS